MEQVLLTSSGLAHASFQQTFVTMLRTRKPCGIPKVLYIPDALCYGLAGHAGFATLQALLGSLLPCQLDYCELRHLQPAALKRRLQGVDAIYVDCGNTFYLRHYMRTSGFDELVPPLLREGVVYVGASSGSIVMGQSVSTALWKGWDDPGYGQEWDLSKTSYDGLGVIPGGKSVFAHYNAYEHDSLIQQRRGGLGDILAIGEDNAYVLSGSRGEFIINANGEVSSISSAVMSRDYLSPVAPRSVSVRAPSGAPSQAPLSPLRPLVTQQFLPSLGFSSSVIQSPSQLAAPWLAQPQSPVIGPSANIPRLGASLGIPALRVF